MTVRYRDEALIGRRRSMSTLRSRDLMRCSSHWQMRAWSSLWCCAVDGETRTGQRLNAYFERAVIRENRGVSRLRAVYPRPRDCARHHFDFTRNWRWGAKVG